MRRTPLLFASVCLSMLAACGADDETIEPGDDTGSGADVDAGGDAAEDGSGGCTEAECDAGDDTSDANEPDGDADPSDVTPDVTPDVTDTGTPDVDDATDGSAADVSDATDGSSDTSDPDVETDTTPDGPPLGTCSTDEDCFGGRCRPISTTEGAWLACQYDVVAATACNEFGGGIFTDECCNSTECNSGASPICVTGPLFYCGGAFPGTYNFCAAAECTTNADCEAGEFCLEGGFFSEPNAVCAPAPCEAHTDCTDRDGGECRPFFSECGGRFMGMACTYADSECREDADCAPIDGFSAVCEVNGAGDPVCVPSVPRP
jgi:hypothetical protein